ncbi:hypothetical protein [Bradyrhizobium sp. SZCCHNS3004]|uniref:hypothetical protein n=1 Tax=Bradyrhizobium sp. SZCCHNS3004 TaxID=3057312 RepID=UPI002916C524|nr:hypothetical protein [Bradyrhizobium sp. SZCCHNS3004]
MHLGRNQFDLSKAQPDAQFAAYVSDFAVGDAVSVPGFSGWCFGIGNPERSRSATRFSSPGTEIASGALFEDRYEASQYVNLGNTAVHAAKRRQARQGERSRSSTNRPGLALRADALRAPALRGSPLKHPAKRIENRWRVARFDNASAAFRTMSVRRAPAGGAATGRAKAHADASTSGPTFFSGLAARTSAHPIHACADKSAEISKRDRTTRLRHASAIRAIAERIWSIIVFTFNSLDPPMVPPSTRQTGFSGKPLALRRRIIEVLERAHRLTAFEIASSAYAERIVLDGRARCSTAQLVAVRRALRRLADRGHVVSHCRQRRWKMWERQS